MVRRDEDARESREAGRELREEGRETREVGRETRAQKREVTFEELVERLVSENRRADRTLIVAVAVGSLFALVGLAVSMIVYFNDRTADQTAANRAGLNCILEQLAEHRYASAGVNRLIAEVLETEIPEQQQFNPPAVDPAARTLCDDYLHVLQDPELTPTTSTLPLPLEEPS